MCTYAKSCNTALCVKMDYNFLITNGILKNDKKKADEDNTYVCWDANGNGWPDRATMKQPVFT